MATANMDDNIESQSCWDLHFFFLISCFSFSFTHHVYRSASWYFHTKALQRLYSIQFLSSTYEQKSAPKCQRRVRLMFYIHKFMRVICCHFLFYYFLVIIIIGEGIGQRQIAWLHIFAVQKMPMAIKIISSQITSTCFSVYRFCFSSPFASTRENCLILPVHVGFCIKYGVL